MKMMCLLAAMMATVSALRAPTPARHLVARVRVSEGALALTPTTRGAVVLAAGKDDDYSAPKIEFDPDAVSTGGVDLWSTWKNSIYVGSIAIGVLLPVFFFFVRP